MAAIRIGGIVQDDVDAAEMCGRARDHGAALFAVADIDDLENGCAAIAGDLVPCFPPRPLAARRDDDLGAFLGEAYGGVPPDALAGAGDDRDPAFQSTHLSLANKFRS